MGGRSQDFGVCLGPLGIHVNSLSLGGILSPWYRESIFARATSAGISFEEQLKIETNNVPLKKYAQPEEVAVAIEGLLSPFSDHMTRVNIL